MALTKETKIARYVPQLNCTIQLRPVQPVSDLAFVFEWVFLDHVKTYWDMGPDREAVLRYLESKLHSGHLLPYLISANDLPIGYAELYEYNQDPLSNFFPGEPGDMGWHILIGDSNYLGTGHAYHAARIIIEMLFSRSNCNRVLCEPDERNQRMIRFVQKLAHRPLTRVQLPDKTGLFLECRRNDFYSSHDYKKSNNGLPGTTQYGNKNEDN